MYSFEIEEIYGDGYERWAKVKNYVSEEMSYVHFIEYDEYLENDRTSIKRKKGDILNGNLKIDLVTQYKVVSDDKVGFIQPINKSSNIIAIGIVKEIEDSDIIICSIRGLGDDIVVEFENDIEAKILEDIASKIKDPNITGEVNLFTELDTCQSCTNIILEFRAKYPNIKLNIFTNNTVSQ